LRLRASTRAAAFAVAVAGFAGSMTGVAWAPKNLSVHVIEAVCEVKNVGSGAFLGAVTLTGFTLDKGQVVGVATVTGTCTLGPGSTVAAPAGTTVLVPVTIQELSCHELELTLGNVSIAAASMTLQTAGTQVFLSPGSRADEARFCAAARLAGTRSLAESLSPLNHLIFQ
jgi:hypothetical protein